MNAFTRHNAVVPGQHPGLPDRLWLEPVQPTPSFPSSCYAAQRRASNLHAESEAHSEGRLLRTKTDPKGESP